MTAESAQRLEASRVIAADADAIFALLREPSGHVAIDATGMLMAASGEAAQAVGDTFVVHMDRDALRDFDLGEYDVIVTYVTYEPAREIAWTVGMSPGQTFGHVYGYRLEPSAGGTLVTHYYDWSEITDDIRAFATFPVIPETALRATLGILARTVAPGAKRPDA
jgi:hypothetical protein